ncbi:hypothetical protein FA15DRAFT_709005 [Coprinopsis marcescibilis]|uniref:Fungal-type protein kinase domain-containing protein n=1 Tax=Coprinopsis marcescibilis TaxID=230819 RepID=A0A5C3KHC8_COPMA|nr:hypothetical protein FA15DRAFT_709005 [Coprinopsis marcescibilis]
MSFAELNHKHPGTFGRQDHIQVTYLNGSLNIIVMLFAPRFTRLQNPPLALANRKHAPCCTGSDRKDHFNSSNASFNATHSLNDPDVPLRFTQKGDHKLPVGAGYVRRSRHVANANASRPCKKLWEVDSVDEFMKVWIDCVKHHNAAYKKGKILRGDLSENSLMFWRTKGIDSEESGSPSVEGVLNDWDMASKPNIIEQVPTSAEEHRSRSLPFMAMEMLVQDPPPPPTPARP